MVLPHEVHQPVSDGYGVFIPAEVRRDVVFLERGTNGASNYLSLRLPAKKFDHHGGGQHRAKRVRNALAGNVRRRAVNRLEQRGFARLNVPRRRQAETARGPWS